MANCGNCMDSGIIAETFLKMDGTIGTHSRPCGCASKSKPEPKPNPTEPKK